MTLLVTSSITIHINSVVLVRDDVDSVAFLCCRMDDGAGSFASQIETVQLFREGKITKRKKKAKFAKRFYFKNFF